MPGTSYAFTTLGNGKDTTLDLLLQNQQTDTNMSVVVTADKFNSTSSATAPKIGRKNACIPIYPGGSELFSSVRASELVFNDQSSAGNIMYFDFTGPQAPDSHPTLVIGGM
jgi:hypothetical protein